MLQRAGKSKSQDATAEAELASKARPALRKNQRWQICNVLQSGGGANQLWRFEARGAGYVLNRTQSARAGESLPDKLIAKSWNSLWQKKLNVAWLPPENVFIRVAQFPQSSPEEM